MRSSPEDRLYRRYCETGDPAALAAVFDRIAPELWRIARHLTRDPHGAEDLVQETFTVAIEKRSQFQRDRRVLPWLLGVLANLARQHHRKTRRATPLERADVQTGVDPAEELSQRELNDTLQRELRGLPEPYRAVLTPAPGSRVWPRPPSPGSAGARRAPSATR